MKRTPVERVDVSAFVIPTEQMLFDGALVPLNGELRPDRSRPGFGLELKRKDADRFAV